MTGAGSGGQGAPDGTEAEEAERCPICLGVLAGGDLAMPDSCCHVFCLGCLLTWAESQTVPSCPVDRRPFTNVYKWDPTLGCVQVPVRKRASQPEAERCCCRNPEQKVCLKSKQGRRLRRQKVERAPDAKAKGLVRKCSDDDPSSMNRKKVRGTQCCTWSPSPFGSLMGTLTQDIAEPVWAAEETPYDSGFKQCKPQTQDCPWLSPAAPIPAGGTSRQSFHPSNWNHSPFPFGSSSSPFTSSSSFGPGHFDPAKSEAAPPAVPGNAPVPVINALPPHPPQMNVLHHHYPLQGPRGALPVSLQPAAPYAMPPQVPMHLHPAVPLLQVPAVGAQGLPPPPPPPPPMQQGSQTAAAQPDAYAAQMASGLVGYGKPPLLPTPTKAGVAVATQGQQMASQALPSSTTQSGQHSKAQADSSKKEKKQQIQERAINEVKTAIKPYYQKKEITKEEYKEIVRKAVEKVCHSKSGEVNSSKVANLVKAYVDKYKHARKK